jgi:heat shock protein HtpX
MPFDRPRAPSGFPSGASQPTGPSGPTGGPGPVGPGGDFAVPHGGRNYLKTAMLMAGLTGLLAMGGAAVGGPRGVLLFGGLGLVFNLVSYWFSDKIALMTSGARPVSREEAPELYAMVEKLTRRAGLPMPSIHVIPSDSPNAFATGRNPAHAAVAVTEGILRILDRRQLEGVLAHELGHVLNRDILISTMAAMVAGLVSSLGYLIRWGGMVGGMRGDREDGPSGLELLGWAIVAPLVAMFLQMAVSRSREYGADATGAAMVGDPEPLAQALERLERGAALVPLETAGPATAHLYIVNPLSGATARIFNLFSTHPPIEERIARLRAMRPGARVA